MNTNKCRVKVFIGEVEANADHMTAKLLEKTKEDSKQEQKKQGKKNKERNILSNSFSSLSPTSTSTSTSTLSYGKSDNLKDIDTNDSSIRNDSRMNRDDVLVLPTSKDMVYKLIPLITEYQEQEKKELQFLSTLSTLMQSQTQFSSLISLPTVSRSFLTKHDHPFLVQTIDQVNNIRNALHTLLYSYPLWRT
jgi:hypothetical protein